MKVGDKLARKKVVGIDHEARWASYVKHHMNPLIHVEYNI